MPAGSRPLLGSGWTASDGLPGYFGYPGPELEEWMGVESAAPYLALMGRKTYTMLSDVPAEATDAEYDKMIQRKTVVFSRTLSHVDWPNARVARDLVAETRRLKGESEIPLRTVGSPTLVGHLVGAGLVDRFRLVTFPLFAGPDGREWAFADIASADLELVEHRVVDGRTPIAEYHLTGKDIPRA